MKQTIAAIVVLAALAAATGQDTVKLPDADFWVVGLIPEGRPRYERDHESWKTGRPTKEWLKAAKKAKSWQVHFGLPGCQWIRTATVTRRIAGIPTRDEVRRCVREVLLRRKYKPQRPPGQLWKLVGRYYREKLRRRLPAPTTGRW